MQDLRLAVRALRATPIVSFVAVLSLALGIGANTAIFSIVDGLLLRSLPVAEPQRLVTISSDFAINLGFKAGAGFTHAAWERIRQQRDAFADALAWARTRLDLSQGGEMRPADALFVSGEFFTTLGVPPLLGRTFTAADDQPGGGPDGPVVVISYGLWQRRFGGAANVIGTPLVIERVPFTIVGVAPPEFFGVEVGETFDVAIPLGTEFAIRSAQPPPLHHPRNWSLLVMLRLKPDQSVAAATTMLRSRQAQILGVKPQELPRFQPTFAREPFTLVPAATGTSMLRERYQRSLLIVSSIVVLVLLIACANIANLLLARAAGRRHELSVRLALGAPRWRLARQLLIESLLLAAIGASLGLLIARWASKLLVAQLSTADARVFLNQPLDWHMLAFTALMTITTAVLFGTAPAFRAARVAPIDALKDGRTHGDDGGSGGSAGNEARFSVSSGVALSLPNALIVAQVALSLVLLVAAGLFLRTFQTLATVPLGFDRDRVLIVTVNTARAQVLGASVSDPSSWIPFYQRLVDAMATIPGVAHAAGSMSTPLSGGGMRETVEVPDMPPLSEPERRVIGNFVTPDYFATYGTPMRAGRDIDAHDTVTAPPALIVNDMFVRRFFPGKSAVDVIGTRVKHGGPNAPPSTIVGVVGDSVYRSLTIGAGPSAELREAVPPTIYLPLAQSGGIMPPGMSEIRISIRSTADSPMPLARSIGAALTAIDRNLAFSFRPLSEFVETSLAQERLIAMLSGFFGALALLLAGLGLYGVTMYAVSRRRFEIGIRLALGAEPSGVVRLVLSRVVWLVTAGIVAGIATSVWLSRFVAPLLFGLQPRDPLTLAAAALMLAAVAAIAGALPASRAARLDPAVVLRRQ
jgi:putative ABC transport system permease protein